MTSATLDKSETVSKANDVASQLNKGTKVEEATVTETLQNLCTLLSGTEALSKSNTIEENRKISKERVVIQNLIQTIAKSINRVMAVIDAGHAELIARGFNSYSSATSNAILEHMITTGNAQYLGGSKGINLDGSINSNLEPLGFTDNYAINGNNGLTHFK